ncbi:hypothetical protein B0H10DRAFT_316632 [Mycena sp. CBHHK59/15]|nr:hypothetical protein B0H10DRAFT_316632 [Mycena sp. CBHHK59/15]
MRTNKEECICMVSQINDLLAAILRLCVKSETGDLAPGTLQNIGKFTETLTKINSFVEGQQSGSKIKRFFRQSENTAQLDACKAGLRQALDVFGIETGLVARKEMTEMRKEAQRRHEELLEIFSVQPDRPESDTSSLVSKGLFNFANRLAAATPSCPSVNSTRHLVAPPLWPCCRPIRRYSMAANRS